MSNKTKNANLSVNKERGIMNADFFKNVIDVEVNFLTFAETYLRPQPSKLTQDEYLSLERKEQNVAKKTSWFTCCTFTGSSRNDKDIDKIGALVLDIDRSGSEFKANLPGITKLLEHWNYCWYETASSTQTTPRYRLVVECEGIDKADYKDACSWLMQKLNLVDDDVLPCAQLMYLPLKFKHAQTLAMRKHMGGQLISSADIQASALDKPTLDGDSPVDDFQLLKVKTDLSKNEVRRVLTFVDPDCSRQEWVEIAFALKHQYDNDDEEGFKIFNDWSEKGDKYSGHGDAQKVWDSANPNGAKTFASVIRMANEKGYKPSASELSFFDTEKLAQLEDEDEIYDWLRKYVENPHKRPQDDRVIHLAATGLSQRVPDTRKALKEMKTEVKRENVKDILTLKASEYYYVEQTGKYYNASIGGEQKVSPWGTEITFRRYYSNMHGPYKGEDNILDVLEIPTVDMMEYSPANKKRVFINKDGEKVLNTYTPPEFGLNILPPNLSGVEKLFDDLIDLNYDPNGAFDEAKWILESFIAHNTIHPGIKLNWAPVLVGSPGSGKSTFESVLRTVLGDSNVVSANRTLCNSPFNAGLFNAAVTFCNEVHINYSNASNWKDYITTPKICIQDKGKDFRHIENQTNFFMCTNDFANPVPLDEHDRRYYLLYGRKGVNPNCPNRWERFKKIHDSLMDDPFSWHAYFSQEQLIDNMPKTAAESTTPEAEDFDII